MIALLIVLLLMLAFLLPVTFQIDAKHDGTTAYRVLIRYELAIPLVAMQAAISVYSLHSFRDMTYPFTKWGISVLALCGCLTYFFGIRLFTLESGGWATESLVGDFYEQMYLTMLTFHLSVTVLAKALISWRRNR